LVASRGGDANHPSWYLNLDANPEVEVQVGGDVFTAKAHTVEGPDRPRLWQRMVETFLYTPSIRSGRLGCSGGGTPPRRLRADPRRAEAVLALA